MTDVNKASRNTITPSGNVREKNGSQSVPTHSDGEIVEISHRTNTAVVSAMSEMPTNRKSLSKLSLPSFEYSNNQSLHSCGI